MSTESSSPHWVDQVEESLEVHRLSETSSVPSSTRPGNVDQASTAINVALRRLQDLRTSIADLSDTTQNETVAHVPTPRIGPNHSAILLSGDEGPDSETVLQMDRLRTTISSAIMARLEAFEATIQRR